MKETLLYGCKIDQPNYMEEILFQQKGYVNQKELMDHAEKWAEKNGYNRLRIHIIDLSVQPDFKKAINL